MASGSGLEKAALLLKCLPPEIVERLLSRLGPEHSGRLRPLLQAPLPGDWSPARQEQMMGELLAQVEAPQQESPAAPPTLSTPTPAQLAAYQAAGDSEPPAPAPAPKTSAGLRLVTQDLPEDPIEALGMLSSDVLAAVLEGEQAHTAALVLGCLPGDRAGEVLKQLPPEIRREASLRLSRLSNPNPLLVGRIVQALVEKGRTLKARTDRRADARFEKMAQMLRVLEKNERLEVLSALDENEPETAARIKELLYQIEDILRIQDRSMQKLLAEIDSKSLATALKNVSDAIRDKVFNNLSKRAREALTEESELLGSVSPALINQAQKVIVDVIQRLDQAGEIVMTD